MCIKYGHFVVELRICSFLPAAAAAIVWNKLSSRHSHTNISMPDLSSTMEGMSVCARIYSIVLSLREKRLRLNLLPLSPDMVYIRSQLAADATAAVDNVMPSLKRTIFALSESHTCSVVLYERTHLQRL